MHKPLNPPPTLYELCYAVCQVFDHLGITDLAVIPNGGENCDRVLVRAWQGTSSCDFDVGLRDNPNPVEWQLGWLEYARKTNGERRRKDHSESRQVKVFNEWLHTYDVLAFLTVLQDSGFLITDPVCE